MNKKRELTGDIPVVTTRVIKLRDRGDRYFVIIDFMTVFGFIPDRLIVTKVLGRNNEVQFSAVLPQKEDKKVLDK